MRVYMMFSFRQLLACCLALLTRTVADSLEPDRLAPLLECKTAPNPHTQHLRIPDIVQNISQTPGVHHFNPTIIALPYWADNQYLLVSRVVTEGLHQESVLCEANVCANDGGSARHEGERHCTANAGLESTAGGLYCGTPPIVLNIPPTPAEQCDGSWSAFPDIPGFHDPRIFWSGKGEPLIIVNSASQYACLGLWIADLRTLYEPLKKLLASQPSQHHSSGPPIAYPQLTELTRNPASSRSPVEKNWFLFFPTPSTSYIHYDLSPPPAPSPPPKSAHQDSLSDDSHSNPVRREALQDHPPSTPGRTSGRTFALLLPNARGHTTPNLTSPLEAPCLSTSPDPRGQPGHWHQATNALRLVLCTRHEATTTTTTNKHCDPNPTDPTEPGSGVVHFAIIHRKFSNVWDLPLRYERYFAVWDAFPPFHMRAISRYPLLFWNETASGWSGRENWWAAPETETDEEKKMEKRDESMRGNSMGTTNSSGRTSKTRTSMNRFDALNLMVNQTFSPFPTANSTTNSTKTFPGHNNTWVQEDHADGHDSPPKQENWAYFTYTPSIAWAWRPRSAFADSEDVLESLNVGYLDDEVILGIGLDDTEQVFARAKAATLLQCLRACPGMREQSTEGDEEADRRNAMLRFAREDELLRKDTENRDFLDVL